MSEKPKQEHQVQPERERDMEVVEVDVYKTVRKAETFLYVPAGQTPEDWPEQLSRAFEPAQWVMSLTLSANRPLAAQPVEKVMEAVRRQGFFLQLPPSRYGQEEDTT